jgi:site-specific DNA recombinase
LLVTKLDRLSRSVKDLGELIDRYFGKWSLLSVADQIDTRTTSGCAG